MDKNKIMCKIVELDNIKKSIIQDFSEDEFKGLGEDTIQYIDYAINSLKEIIS